MCDDVRLWRKAREVNDSYSSARGTLLEAAFWDFVKFFLRFYSTDEYGRPAIALLIGFVGFAQNISLCQRTSFHHKLKLFQF